MKLKAEKKSFVRLVITTCCLASMSILFMGCAMTRTNVAVNFSPTASDPLGQNPAAQLSVGDIQDTRPVADKFVICQKYNGYGERTSGAYVAPEPVADIFKNGLIQSLKTNGFLQSTNDVAYELTATIQDFDHDVIVGFWKSTVKPKLTVRFELTDKKTGLSVWHDTLIGRDSMETSWGGSDFLVQTFDNAANDVIRQLISDKSFRNYFLSGSR